MGDSPYANCLLCPRLCSINREAGVRSYCGESSELRVGFAGIHRGEEPPISGNGGSGTIFITGCNLGCVFCQNYQLSQEGMGRVVSTGEFAEICLALQRKGVENINIVTGSHAAPAIALGIEEGRKQGLNIPVLWNSSGYDGEVSLEILKDIVDVYLPDLKTLDSRMAKKFYNTPDYPEHAVKAILKMMDHRALKFSPHRYNVLVSGVMIRHLVVPDYLEATRQVLCWFSENCRGRALLSLMTQYTPVYPKAAPKTDIPPYYLSNDEYLAVLSMLNEFGIEDGYCQELETGSDWLPDFNRINPFSSDLSVSVWHWS